MFNPGTLKANEAKKSDGAFLAVNRGGTLSHTEPPMGIPTQHIGDGFYKIRRSDAIKLGGGSLPKHGTERKVVSQGEHHWLARTQHKGKQVWSLRSAERMDMEARSHLPVGHDWPS